MKVRLGTQREVPQPMPVTNKPGKKITEFPSITLNSNKVKEVAGLEKGNKCILTFEAEVKGTREPEEWQMREEGLDKKDTVADFRLISVTLQSKGKNYESARKEAMEGK